MSGIILFSLVRDHFLMMPKNDFESVNKIMGIARPVDFSKWKRIVKASSNLSANAITSAERIDLVTRLDF